MDLRKEFTDSYRIYQKQKEYRKTSEGKAALKRAQKKWNEKRKMANLQLVSGLKKPKCKCCGEKTFEFLTVWENIVLCYNCKSQGLNCPHIMKGEKEIAC